jgi:hypothetical protein
MCLAVRALSQRRRHCHGHERKCSNQAFQIFLL